MKGGLGGLMKQAQKMQENIKRGQEELATMEVVGESGGCLVKVTMTGRHEVRRVEIDPSVVSGEDRDMLEDLVAAASNDAVHRVEQMVQEKFSGMTSGMGLPPGMSLPF